MLRAAIRRKLRASTGASVAMTRMQEPSPVFGAACRNSLPTGAPLIVRFPPKFVCTSTPDRKGAGRAGCRPNSIFESECNSACARPDCAFLHWTTSCVLDCLQNFRWSHVPAADIVQVTVIRFGYQRIYRAYFFVSGE